MDAERGHVLQPDVLGGTAPHRRDLAALTGRVPVQNGRRRALRRRRRGRRVRRGVPGRKRRANGERLSAAGDAAGPAANDATYLSPGGRDRARRWRAVVGRLALASLRRVQSELGASPDGASLSLGAEDSFLVGSDLDRADTTSTFVPVSSGSADDVGTARVSRPRSPPFAVRRSRARSSLEWQDLSLIASYMTTTRLLSASLDEWRARTAAAKARRQRERERRRATAMAERERSRVVFARGVFLGWRDAVRRQTRERRARYGSVSRASIRKLTRSPLDRISPSSASKSLRKTFSGSGGAWHKTQTQTPSAFGSADRFGSASAIDLGFAGREPGGDAFTPRTAPPPLKLFRTGS